MEKAGIGRQYGGTGERDLIYRLIGRTVVVAFAFFCAVCAAAAFFTLAKVGPAALSGSTPEEDILRVLEFTFVSAMVATSIGQLVLIPMFAAIIATEAFRWRGIVTHLAIGAAVGAGTMALNFQTAESGSENLTLATAAGACGGFVYWLLAGRKAGGWQGANAEPSSLSGSTEV